MRDDRGHDWSVDFVGPDDVWPVLLHTGQQQLVDHLVLKSRHIPKTRPRVAVRLRGLIDDPWPVPIATPICRRIVIDNPPNPPVNLDVRLGTAALATPAILEILIDGSRVFGHEVKLRPANMVPGEPDQSLALTALVLPQAAEIAELNELALAAFVTNPKEQQRGYPQLTPEDAAWAIYGELSRRRLIYSWEPAPWAASAGGQLVRLVGDVLTRREGTCIDLALLFCSALERVRKLPVLLWIQFADGGSHLIPGVRVDDDHGPAAPLLADITQIRASCARNVTFLLDPASLASQHSPEHADASARGCLRRASAARFIDVQAAREAGIWPMPLSGESGMRPRAPAPAACQCVVEHQPGIPPELAREVAAGQAVFIFGDVLDPALVVSRLALAEKISRMAGLPVPDGLLAGTRIQTADGRVGLEKAVRALLNHLPPSPTETYRRLGRLPTRTILSFHPDAMLEDLLGSISPPFSFLIEDDDLATLQPSREAREVYLLGGSARSGRGLVLTEADHHRLRRRIDLLARGLRERLALRPLVLVGCDLDDINFRELYIEATRHLSYSAQKIYATGCSAPSAWSGQLTILPQAPADFIAALEHLVPVAAPSEREAVPTVVATTDHPPFKYLDYFDAEDAGIFFGRDADGQRIAREILASPSRIVILFGPSGVGKTSLIKAAVIPHFERSGLKTAYTRFGNEPEHSIRSAIWGEPRQSGRPARDSKDPHATLREELRNLYGTDRKERVLVIDQVEEAFIRFGRPARDEFFDLVQQCVVEPQTGIRLVFILRADFLAQLADHQRQVPGLLAAPCALAPLSYAAAAAAVEGPARQCGIQVEASFVEEMLHDLSPDEVMPSQLQIVCEHVYRACGPGRIMSLEAYERLGRAERILREYLGQAVGNLPEPQSVDARRILRTLVTSQQTKDLLTLSQVAARSQLDAARAYTILHELIHQLRIVRELTGSELQYELAHECLAPSIAGWLDARDLRIREVQEIVSQEVSNLRRFATANIPADRMRLILEHCPELSFNDEAIRAISCTFVAAGAMPPAWVPIFNRLAPPERMGILAGPDAIQSPDTTARALVDLPSDLVPLVPPECLCADITSSLGALILHAGPAATKVWLAYAAGRCGQLLTALWNAAPPDKLWLLAAIVAAGKQCPDWQIPTTPVPTIPREEWAGGSVRGARASVRLAVECPHNDHLALVIAFLNESGPTVRASRVIRSELRRTIAQLPALLDRLVRLSLSNRDLRNLLPTSLPTAYLIPLLGAFGGQRCQRRIAVMIADRVEGEKLNRAERTMLLKRFADLAVSYPDTAAQLATVISVRYPPDQLASMSAAAAALVGDALSPDGWVGNGVPTVDRRFEAEQVADAVRRADAGRAVSGTNHPVNNLP